MSWVLPFKLCWRFALRWFRNSKHKQANVSDETSHIHSTVRGKMSWRLTQDYVTQGKPWSDSGISWEQLQVRHHETTASLAQHWLKTLAKKSSAKLLHLQALPLAHHTSQFFKLAFSLTSAHVDILGDTPAVIVNSAALSELAPHDDPVYAGSQTTQTN